MTTLSDNNGDMAFMLGLGRMTTDRLGVNIHRIAREIDDIPSRKSTDLSPLSNDILCVLLQKSFIINNI